MLPGRARLGTSICAQATRAWGVTAALGISICAQATSAWVRTGTSGTSIEAKAMRAWATWETASRTMSPLGEPEPMVTDGAVFTVFDQKVTNPLLGALPDRSYSFVPELGVYEELPVLAHTTPNIAPVPAARVVAMGVVPETKLVCTTGLPEVRPGICSSAVQFSPSSAVEANPSIWLVPES